ncbi:LppX_LprAFG lipoprotein [Gordonia humi]|uniref:Lipoprotein LprA n=1 Tax=Gordonia humi TaxID=686429 RepID=A0A840EZY8_9ACTN|nr:LppX_LprAFG lipoprotein [Gordonia humi]MBB4135868.1 lipoprotein LprA [Gordonia humi]
MNRSHRLVVSGAAAAIAAAMVLTGCSDNDDGGENAPTTSDSTAKSALDAAATATEELTGAHVVMTVDGAIQSLNATKVDADIETEPQLEGKGTTTLNMGGTTVQAPFVYIDGRLYANIDDQGFQDYGDGRSIYDVSKILDPEKGVPNILRNVEGATADGDETVNGVEATKITGTVTGETLAAITSTAPGGKAAEASYDATVWIAKDGDEVARVLVSPADDVTVTIDLDKWNEKVDVVKPKTIEAPTEKPDAPTSGQPTREKAN